MSDPVRHFDGVARSAIVGDGSRGLMDVFTRIKDLPGASSITLLNRDDHVAGAARFNVCRDGATGFWEFLNLRPGYHMVVTNTVYKEPISDIIPGEGLLEFHFKLSGGLLLERDGQVVADVTGPSILIWRQNRGVDVHESIAGGEREVSVTVYCSQEFIEKTFGAIADDLNDDAKSLFFNNQEPIISTQLPLGPSLAVQVDALVNAPGQSPLGLMMAEAKGMDLMSSVLSSLLKEKKVTAPGAEFKRGDTIRLHQAHDILEAEYTNPPTIPVLARRVGLNETKLKKGFIKLFNCSVSEFVRKRRLQLACQLMRDRSMPLSTIAWKVGYEHQNSFTVAFKDAFGVLPSQFRKSGAGQVVDPSDASDQ